MHLNRAFCFAACTAVLGLVPVSSFAAQVDPRAARALEASGRALHASAMHGVRTVHLSGTIVSAGLPGTADAWIEVGGVRSTQTFATPPLAGANGWDGRDNWNLDQTGLVWVDASDAGRASTISQTFLLDDDLWTPRYGGATVAWGGTKRDGGRAYDVVTVTAPGSKLPFDLWIDRSTHLPARAVQATGPVVATTTLAKYRPVHGLLEPFSLTTTTSDGNSTSLTFTAADADPADAPAHLAKPVSNVHDFSIADGAAQTSVPIRLSENHVYIDVMLDGRGPYHFIFDTGGANIIDPAVAKEIGASGSGNVQVGGVGNATVSSSFATVKTLQAGGATVRDQVFAVLPVRQGFGLTAGLPADGLIGFEVLSRFVTTFDYANDRVTFSMPGSYAAPAGAATLPIAQNGTQPQFACAIDAVPATCTLDTGARDSLTLFTPFMTAHPRVIPAKLAAKGVNGFGVGGPALGRLGRTQTLAIGPYALHDLVGDYTTQTHGAFAAPFVGANVGGGVWKRFTMTLDYAALTMTLSPNAQFAVPDAWDRSGMFLVNGTGPTVYDVRPGTPAAAAGIAKGDAIVSIGGTPTSGMSLRDVRDVFLQPAGTVVHLVMQAGNGASRSVDLTLADYV